MSTALKLCTASTLTILFAGQAQAESLSQPATVVELFTSQGCSSCPVANARIVELDETRPDVLALSYGVTYWDYLGWPDTFGDPDFTARQRQYDAMLESGVYTPMFVKAGEAHSNRVTDRSLDHHDVPHTVSLMRHSGELCVDSTLPPGTKLALVDYDPGRRTVAVKGGENSGRTLTLANVVTGVSYRDWNGDTICGLHPKSALAVIAHDAKTAAIVGAARLEP